MFARSPPKVISRAKSEGLIGAACTSINTSSSVGVGTGTLVIDNSTFHSLVTVDLISFEYLSVMTTPLWFSTIIKIYNSN